MSPPRSGRRRCRGLFGVTAVAMVMVVGVPVALAAYTGSYAPTQAVTPRQLSTPASFDCNGGNSVSLSWTDSDATSQDPYASPTAYAISGYEVERSDNGGSNWTQIDTPSRLATSTSDNDFGALSVGTQILYRMRSTTPANWKSAYTSTITAKVTSILFLIRSVTCPFP